MTITLHKNDLPANISFGDCVAVDTESKGEYAAPNLKKLMADPKVTKLFHFARADLAAIKYWLGVMPQPIYCTKIASILVRTFTDRHGLKDLARDLINLDMSKEQQTSDWGAATLTQDQMNYAASDVLHLHKMKARLDDMLARENRTTLARQVMDFIPIRAELDIGGWSEMDVFAHRPNRRAD
jgi:ribonuclease D